MRKLSRAAAGDVHNKTKNAHRYRRAAQLLFLANRRRQQEIWTSFSLWIDQFAINSNWQTFPEGPLIRHMTNTLASTKNNASRKLNAREHRSSQLEKLTGSSSSHPVQLMNWYCIDHSFCTDWPREIVRTNEGKGVKDSTGYQENARTPTN